MMSDNKASEVPSEGASPAATNNPGSDDPNTNNPYLADASPPVFDATVPFPVHVSGLKPTTTEQDVREMFKFCGDIAQVELSQSPPQQGEQQGEAAASTAECVVHFITKQGRDASLLLDGAEVQGAHIRVESPNDVANRVNRSHSSGNEIMKSLASFAASGMVFGQTLADNLQRVDQRVGVSRTIQEKTNQVDQKLRVTENTNQALGTATRKMSEIDMKYRVSARGSEMASSSSNAVNNASQKAMQNENVSRGMGSLKGGWATLSGKVNEFFQLTQAEIDERLARQRRERELQAQYEQQQQQQQASQVAVAEVAPVDEKPTKEV